MQKHHALDLGELRIIYLEEPLVADDPVAKAFDLPALEAGYHALEVFCPTEADLEEVAQCKVAIERGVIEEYNAEHGTEFTHDDIVPCGSDINTPASCSEEMADLLRAVVDLIAETESGETRYEQLGRELGCRARAETRRRVLSADELGNVSVRIAPDVRPSNVLSW